MTACMSIPETGTYITRCGLTAIVTEDTEWFDPIYKWRGKILNNDGTTNRLAWWLAGGRYSTDEITQFDIVSTV